MSNVIIKARKFAKENNQFTITFFLFPYIIIV